MLLVYCIGLLDPALLPRFKRTRFYGARDFELISGIVGRFSRLATTPNVLTEVSNLSPRLEESFGKDYFQTFSREIALLDERYVQSRVAMRNVHAAWLGLTDAAVIEVARGEFLVLTADVDLYLALTKEGVDCINYNHIRTI
ncbi:MAG: hypothetical protein HY000_21130 [Planctomycetes bacterium]|nr:hypothetical protein [Planctomycetota bacterium]